MNDFNAAHKFDVLTVEQLVKEHCLFRFTLTLKVSTKREQLSWHIK